MTSELDRRLRCEVLNLMHYIARLQQEIAGVAQKANQQTPFEGMADRLDAIVESTAAATDVILDATESIDGLVAQVRTRPSADQLEALCDRISAQTTEAMEACSFHDLTGQRVSKIVGSLRFVEERVNVMADICGRNEIESIRPEVRLEPHLDDGVPMHGPTVGNEAISQDDIDSLFG